MSHSHANAHKSVDTHTHTHDKEKLNNLKQSVTCQFGDQMLPHTSHVGIGFVFREHVCSQFSCDCVCVCVVFEGVCIYPSESP